MKAETRAKLDIIAELYPKERLEKSKERWRRAWAGEPVIDRYPFMFNPIAVDYYAAATDAEARLNELLDEIIRRAPIQDDFIPTLFPGCRQSTIPGMLGAKEIIIKEDCTCERILKSTDDIWKLPEPSIQPGTPAWDWIEMTKYFMDECEGALPVHVCDMQGPMDAAGQIFGYDNLYLSAYEDEDAFDALMHKAMDAFYLIWEEQQRICGDNFVPTHLYGWSWVPANGPRATVSADCMAMLSDNFFRTYYVPYLREMAARLGTIAVHSCGNFKAVTKALGEIPEVVAVNASQMTIKQLIAAGWNKNKMMICGGVDYAEVPEFAAEIRENKLRVDMTIVRPRDRDGSIISFPKDGWTNKELETMNDCVKRLSDILSNV